MFSIQNCGLPTCEVCKAPNLPADIFSKLRHIPDPMPEGESNKSFDESCGKITKAEHRPSMRKLYKDVHFA